ncbi:LysR substrate-binding domain-containing protein [Rhizobium sp. 2MFCol3.1]|uniref:LysR substrate-binding domain-containing protein n=1 Tax=Rhizobium sp. 2MFCol3.1 TaxID=1246459 RepID=UPI00037C2FEE|nr:LysR substrate-binding domain-containing protein [Rhizobium sp. 2MFCol3.1]
MDRFDLLRLFVMIADHGSLSAAARAQALSASTVTLGLQRLEERVGARLVVRTTRRLSLTHEGERFLLDCRRILSDLEEAMDGVADHGALQGDIRVTATSDLGRSRIAPLVDEFMKLHTGVRIALTLSDAVIDLVESGYDLGFRIGQLRDSRLTARLLLHGKRHVCAAPSYWEQMGRPKHPRDLSRHNCMVLAEPEALKAHWHFQEDGRQFSVRVEGDRTSNDGAVLRDWAVKGAGIVLKSSLDIMDDLAANRLEPVLDDFALAESNLYAVHPAGRRPSRRVRALVDYFSQALRR